MFRHYLIDASALVPSFLDVKTPGSDLNAKQAVAKLLAQRAAGGAVLYVPNFCMAECSKAFAKLAYGATKDHEKGTKLYTRLVTSLLETVSKSQKGLIRSHELERDHLVDVEEVFRVEHKLFPHEKHNLLSGLDALVIKMAQHLARRHGQDHALIVTGEERMTKVCNHSGGRFPRAVNISKHPVPGS